MKAVIFDMDGVLIDSEAVHQKCEVNALAQHGLPITSQDLKPYAGASRQAFQEGITKRYGVELDWDSVFESKDALFYRLMEEVQTLPGVVDLLHEIKNAGLLLGLATSSQRRSLDFVLNKFHWEELFDVTVCAADITRSKPDPQIFLIAAERLGMKPGECIVIEDSVNGVRAAKAAGMFAMAITGTFPGYELHEADRIIDAYDELAIKYLQSL